MSIKTQATSVFALHAHRLRESGARTLTGVVSDSGGVLRGKTVPAARIEVFAERAQHLGMLPGTPVSNSIRIS